MADGSIRVPTKIDLDGLKKGLVGNKQTQREKELEKENAALREEIAILKKAAAFLANVKHE